MSWRTEAAKAEGALLISLGEGSQWTLKNPLELLAPWMWAHLGKHCVSIQWLFSLIFHQKGQQQPNPEYSTSWSSDFHQEVAGCNLLQKENRLMCPIYQVRDLNIDRQIKGVLPALQQGFRQVFFSWRSPTARSRLAEYPHFGSCV